MRIILPIAAVALLAGCAHPLSQQDQANLATAAVSLAEVAAAHNTTAATILQDGALVCGYASGVTGQLATAGVVAVANSAGVPVSVTQQGAATVATVCSALGKVPGPLPAGVAPADVPVVAVAGSGLPTVPAVPAAPVPVAAAGKP